MRCNVRDDGCKRPDAQVIMVWDGDMVLARLVASQADVTAGLPGDVVPEFPKRLAPETSRGSFMP
jgi:hypothetical protein